MWACGNGHADVALALIDRGANVEAVNEFGRTPLICACDNGHVHVALVLASRGRP